MDCCLPGSSVHGILQARILEWVAMPSSRGHSWPRDWSWVSPIADSLPSEPPGKPWCQAYKDPIKQLWLSRRSYESEGLGAAFAEKALNTESLGWSPRCPIVPPIWSWHTHRSCHLAAVVGFLGAPAASWHEQWVSQSFQGKSKLAFLVGREILLLKVPNRTPEANPQLGWPLAWSKSHECFLSKVLGISTLASLDWTLEYPFQTPSPTPPILVMGTSDLVGVWTHQGPGAPFLGSPLSGLPFSHGEKALPSTWQHMWPRDTHPLLPGQDYPTGRPSGLLEQQSGGIWKHKNNFKGHWYVITIFKKRREKKH